MELHRHNISKPLYVTFVTYLLISVFQSAGLQVAFISAVTIFITQIILFPILPLVSTKISKRALPFVATFLACVIGVSVTYLIDIGFSFSFPNESVFFPFPSFLLIAVPLFVTQAEQRSEYSFSFVMKSFFSFFLFLLITSGVREVLGFGTCFGYTVISGETGPLPFLTHASGSAFLVVSLILLFLAFYRAISRRNVILDTDKPLFEHQPIIDLASRASELRLFLTVFLVTLLSAIPLYAFCMFVYLPAYSYFLLVTILVLGAVNAVLRVAFSKNQDFRSSYFDKKFLFPVQAGIVAFPASIFFSFSPEKEYVVLLFLLITFFILLACVVESVVVMFIRSMRRKSLFGKRPEILQGVPYPFLILSLCFMVLSGFGDVPGSILSLLPF